MLCCQEDIQNFSMYCFLHTIALCFHSVCSVDLSSVSVRCVERVCWSAQHWCPAHAVNHVSVCVNMCTTSESYVRTQCTELMIHATLGRVAPFLGRVALSRREPVWVMVIVTDRIPTEQTPLLTQHSSLVNQSTIAGVVWWRGLDADKRPCWGSAVLCLHPVWLFTVYTLLVNLARFAGRIGEFTVWVQANQLPFTSSGSCVLYPAGHWQM